MLCCDGDGELGSSIGRFGEFLEAQGAWFDPQMVIRCEGGGIAIHAAEAFSPARSLLSVPLNTMPLVEDFDWRIERTDQGRELRAEPRSDAGNALHRETMDCMVSVYNQAGKLDEWAALSPWFLPPSEDALLEALLISAANVPKPMKFAELRRSGEHEGLLTESFLGSRVFNLAPENREAAGHVSCAEGAKVLMPVIDYFNHRFAAQGYSIRADQALPDMQVAGAPDAESLEVFVRYTQLDAISAYLNYGFVDETAPFLSSIPMTISAQGKVLNIIGQGGMVKRELPDHLKDIRLFMPQIRGREGDQLTMNKMLFPGPRAPRALQRVLAALLGGIGVPQASLRSAVKIAESQLVEANEAHWQRVRDLSSHLDDRHQANILWRHCLGHIEQYKRIRPRID